nr:hypothetical protein [uncultured Prevotella sp.]
MYHTAPLYGALRHALWCIERYFRVSQDGPEAWRFPIVSITDQSSLLTKRLSPSMTSNGSLLLKANFRYKIKRYQMLSLKSDLFPKLIIIFALMNGMQTAARKQDK